MENENTPETVNENTTEQTEETVEETTPTLTFEELPDALRDACDRAGWDKLMPVQERHCRSCR